MFQGVVMMPSGEITIGNGVWDHNRHAGFVTDWVTQMPAGSKDHQDARTKERFRGMDPFAAYQNTAGGREDDQAGAWEPRAWAQSFDGMGSQSEFLHHFQLVAELNG